MVYNGKGHPTPEQIQRYNAGFMKPEESTQVESHLENCDDCRDMATMAAIDTTDDPGEEEEDFRR